MPSGEQAAQRPGRGRDLGERADAEGDEDGQAGQCGRGAMQRPGQERGGQPREHAVHGEHQEIAGERRTELGPGSSRNGQPLRAVAGPGRRQRPDLRRPPGGGQCEHQQSREDEVDQPGEAGYVRREQPGRQGADRQAADVRDRGHDLRSPRRDTVRPRVQVGEVGAGGGGGRPQGQACQHSPDEQGRKRGGRGEDQRSHQARQQSGEEHGPSPVPVRDMADEEQARHDPGGEDGVHDGDGDRRQVVLSSVEPVERAWRGGEGGQDRHARGDRPEAGGPAQSSAPRLPGRGRVFDVDS